MGFKIRKYNSAVEDGRLITLIQVIPCLNVGSIFDMMNSEMRYNFAIGWLCWICEWSWLKKNKQKIDSTL